MLTGMKSCWGQEHDDVVQQQRSFTKQASFYFRARLGVFGGKAEARFTVHPEDQRTLLWKCCGVMDWTLDDRGLGKGVDG